VQGHNLVYLHVNYNTFRLAFWALAHLTNNAEAAAAVTSEIDDIMESRDGGDDDVITLSVDDLDNLQVLGKGILSPPSLCLFLFVDSASC